MEELVGKIEALEAGNLFFLGLDVCGVTAATTTEDLTQFKAMEEEGKLKIECERPATLADLWMLYPDEMKAETGKPVQWSLTRETGERPKNRAPAGM
ncbi:hypothetical protein FTO70_14360 [Methanosarcina sp. KYL-1]|uniref:hypothetical protein n=1 Tax=Methanosarcina sp. KYL-1 TaxID=2602068 RepID=UPI002100FDA5|nr:hypothetical protein [Methanosarcina sp. KYL-1]MCQ1536833.1 hypothetical protein [Methanosarcina sp. KYL-1]